MLKLLYRQDFNFYRLKMSATKHDEFSYSFLKDWLIMV